MDTDLEDHVSQDMDTYSEKAKLLKFRECDTDIRLDGKVAIVTEATTTIGLATAENLAKRGARVILASRYRYQLIQAKEAVIRAAGHTNVDTRMLDFRSLSSVRDFVNITMETEERLDILFNNVGGIGYNDTLTNDGLHTIMQVNYFASFLLTFLLFPFLEYSAPSRIVNLSSSAILLGVINFDHMNDVGACTSFQYYANAQLASLLFSMELDKRIKGSQVSINSMDPGLDGKEFQEYFNNKALTKLLNNALKYLDSTKYDPDMVPVFLAIDPRVKNATGKLFRGCNQYYIPPIAKYPSTMVRLWEVSKRLVRITPEEDWEKHVCSPFYKHNCKPKDTNSPPV